jgi:hypothetical protein
VDKRVVRLSTIVHPGPKVISCPDPSAKGQNLANILSCFFYLTSPFPSLSIAKKIWNIGTHLQK